MLIRIKQPFSLNETGGRENNEDSVFPPKGKAGADDRLFMVCDGVGGHDKGEIASRIVTESFGWYFVNTAETGNPRDYISGAVSHAQDQLDKYISQNPSSRGMGTTLAMIWITDEGVISVHAGDSRIYQFRHGRIIFQSSDHSVVNTLVRLGEITEEEARTHPEKNKILQCFQGNNVSEVREEVHILADILPGDSFFLCSDGILEQFSNKRLEALFAEQISGSARVNKIKQACQGNTKDNFSAYLVEIEAVEFPGEGKEIVIEVLPDEIVQKKVPPVSFKQPEIPERQISKPEEGSKTGSRNYILFGIIIVILGFSGYMIITKFFHKKEENKKEIVVAGQTPVTPVIENTPTAALPEKKEVQKPEPTPVKPAETGSHIVVYKENNKWGLLDSSSKTPIVRPIYDELILGTEFSRVKTDSLYGLISNSTGKEVIPCSYAAISAPNELSGRRKDTINVIIAGKAGQFARKGQEWVKVQPK
jgi:protein phosphatase